MAQLVLALAAGHAAVRMAPLRVDPNAATRVAALAVRMDAARANGADPGAADNESEPPPNLFELGMRAATGNENYRFGDITKQTITDLTGKDIEQYEFGDITKRAIANFTGKEEYEFGDITNKMLSDADNALSTWRDDQFASLPEQIWRQLFADLPPAQRRALIIAIVQIGSCAVLSFGLASSLADGFTLALAAVTAPSHAAVPYGGEWARLMLRHQTVRLALDPMLLPARARATWIILTPNRRAVSALGATLPLAARQPVLSRVLVRARP